MLSLLLRTAVAAVILSCAAVPALAQASAIPRGAALFIEEMDNDLDGFLRAEFVKQRVPLTVVLRREEAHLVLTGTSTEEQKRKWHEGWLTAEQDRTAGNVMVFDRASKQLLWAGEAGDRSFWWGAMARGGQRKVASRLVKNLKKAIRSRATPLAAPPPLDADELPPASSHNAPAPGAPVGHDSTNVRPLVNDDIVKMVGQGISDDLVIAAIRRSATAFVLTPEALIALKNQGVSDRVVAVMLESE